MQAAYSPPFIHRNTHFATIIPNLFRKVNLPNWERIEINTSDGDFIDVDTLQNGSSRAILLLHGLEGSSESTYIRGLSQLLFQQGYDVLAMNHRGCSGRPNRLVSAYHSGKTDDVRDVLDHFKNYTSIGVIGFSLGGNMALKLAGELKGDYNKLKAVVGISVPVDLAGSSDELSKWKNRLYLQRFLKQLKEKALSKAKAFPDYGLDIKGLKQAQNFREFDDLYTAPAHGFLSAADYYKKSSSKQFLSEIEVPTLLINALNDSFLSQSCYPIDEAKSNSYITYETPSYGGHVGFANDTRMREFFWHERRTLDFLTETIPV